MKPSRPDAVGSDLNNRDDGLEWRGATVLWMVQYTYGLSEGSADQVIGAPGWMRTKRFDAVAKEDPGTAARMAALPSKERDAQLRVMMQALLAERFGLKVHREPRPLTVLALTVAQGGPKLKPAVQDEKMQWYLHNSGGTIDAKEMDLAALVAVLSTTREVGGRLVVDETGLTGTYDYTVTYTPEQPSGAADGTGLFAALQEQLGLRLVARKEPVSCVVIDHAELPTAN